MAIPPAAWASERLKIHQLIDLVTSQSTRVPPGLRAYAAYVLLDVKQTLDDYLEIVALREFENDGQE